MAIYLGEVPFVPQLGDEAIVEAYLGEDLMWSKWKLFYNKVLWADWDNSYGHDAYYYFDNPVKIVSAQFKIRTSGGSNYRVYIYIQTGGNWVLLDTLTGVEDNVVQYFSDPELRAITGIRIYADGSVNVGVMRYVCEVILNSYYQNSDYVEWSYSDRRPSSGYSNGYHNTYELSYTLPNTTNYKIESIHATGYCQTSGDEYYCGVQIQIYRNGAWSTVVDTGQQINEANAYWSNTNEYMDITQVRAVKTGLKLRSAVALSISGIQMGN